MRCHALSNFFPTSGISNVACCAMRSKLSEWHIQRIWQNLPALYQRLVTQSGRGNEDGRLEKPSNLKTALGFQQSRPLIREEAHNIQRNDERTVKDIMNGTEQTPRPTISCGSDHQINQNCRL